MMIDPDAELVARVGRGDRAAAAALMARHLPRMLALARRMLSDPAEADDAVQDAFMQLWTHAARWEPGRAKFGTWLYRVTLNKCYKTPRFPPRSRPLWPSCPSASAPPSSFATTRDAAILKRRRSWVSALKHLNRCWRGGAARFGAG